MDIERSGSIASCLAGQIIKQVGAQFPAERIPDLKKMISVF